ncbi:MAG: ribosome maturation factor RimM [Gemmatimonadota bacterium]
MPDARHLVVGRLRKPHGLKGEFTIFPLTDDPDAVFTPGRELWRMDLEGTVVGGPHVIERSRGYHREWLLKFREVDARDDMETWRGQFLGADIAGLAPPANGEVYIHELEGFSVRAEDDEPLGLVTGVYEVAGGLVIEVQGPKREFMLPYRKEFVVRVERDERRLTVVLPEGLLDQ